ncbi:Hypothetical predicted protein, partial [Podarcis lilfordi]
AGRLRHPADQHPVCLWLRVSGELRAAGHHPTHRQVLHDSDHSPPPPPGRVPQGPCRHWQDGDGEGPGQGSGHVRHCGQLLRRPGLQVNGAHVLRPSA